MTTQQKYQKSIRSLLLEREFTQGKVCKNPEHTDHIMATTISCLRSITK